MLLLLCVAAAGPAARSLARAFALRPQIAARKVRKATRRTIFKRAEAYVKEYRTKERSLVRARRQAQNAGNFFVEAASKVAFVIRIRGINAISPTPKKVLQLLRLR